MHSDETLWDGLLRGDEDMFLSIYKRYYHALFFVGLKEIRDAQLVKDTIQQLFLYLWEKRATIHAARNVKAYLITSFLRKLSDDWKKSGRMSNLQVVHSEYADDAVPTPEESLIDKDEQQHLNRLLFDYITELPTRQRELINLRFYEGLSYDEIVLQTGLSHRTVYNKIHEALKKLRLDIVSSKSPHSASLLLVVAALTLTLPV
jgi:RNA polymerase sigma factor (sigma-70 family)